RSPRAKCAPKWSPMTTSPPAATPCSKRMGSICRSALRDNPMKIYIAGHRGMVGGAILRQLQARGTDEIITRTSAELDLTDQAQVRDFLQGTRPDLVILAAAKVGGIHANNTYPAQFIYENLMIAANVIHQSHA